jgi:predicted secreted protein
MENKSFTLFLFFCTLFIILPLNITNLTLDNVSSGTCDYSHHINTHIPQYIFGFGITCIVTSVILIICYILMLRDLNVTVGIIGVSIPNGILGSGWIIIGARLVNISNDDCIRNGIIHIFYGFVLWCISIINIFREYHETNNQSSIRETEHIRF